MDDFKISWRGDSAVLYPMNQNAIDWTTKKMRNQIGRMETHFDDGILLDKETAQMVVIRIMGDFLTIGK